MQITFTGTLDELVAFAEHVRPRATVTASAPMVSEETKMVKPSPKKTEKTAEKVVDKPVEKAEDPTPASAETPMPPASNGALAILKNAMAALITAKGRDEVTKLLAKYGVEKVSQVKESDVAAMTEEARSLAK